MKSVSRTGAVILCAMITVSAITVAAECLRAIVTESDIVRQPEDTPPTSNWVLYTRAGLATASFVYGPSNPPEGIGSLEMQTPLPTDKVTLFNFDHAGTRLQDITSMGYSTYRDPTSVTMHPAQVPSINIQVDYNGDLPGGFTTLVFEPVYNLAQGTVIPAPGQCADGAAGGYS